MEPLGTRPPNTAPDANVILPDRRRRPRYKTYTPAYVRLNAESATVKLDLSEILDINEDGIAVQAAPPLEANRQVNLCIDLSETNTYINTTGFVVWSDRSGKAGIRLPNLPDASRQQLREWLFLNALAACASSAGVSAKAAEDVAPEEPSFWGATATAASPALDTVPEEEPSSPAARDYTSVLSALAAVEKEVELLGNDVDAAVELLVERAQAFTRASSAAVALYPGDPPGAACSGNGSYMVCRARAGSGAPPLGAQLQVGNGLSGECVRSKRPLRCDDSETDPCVDRESCRMLGIRSILAAPIRYGDEVIGLLEVFSPSPCAFNDSDSNILQRLAETALRSLTRRIAIQDKSRLPLASDDSATPAFTKEGGSASPLPQHLSGIPVHRAHLVFLLTVAALIALVLGFLVAPWIDNKWTGRAAPQAKQQPTTKTPEFKTAAEAATVDDLRKLAEQGDSTAQFALGAHYATGEDVDQDYGQALRWFSKAAERGNVAAQSALGAYYWVGRGAPRDLEKAYFWSVLARASGDETSKYRVAVLTSRMTRPQILAVQQQADRWLRQHQGSENPSPAQ